MSTFGDVTSIKLLKNLFDQCRDDDDRSSDSDGDYGANSSSAGLGPGNIKPKKKENGKQLENSLLMKIEPEAPPQSMKEFDELRKIDEELLDTRKQPEYSVMYKQAVTSEDIYLQMTAKTAATSSCYDHMIIEVLLPEETVKIDKMDLNVEPKDVMLQTPIYRLKLPLPHRVDPKKGRAEYDTEKKILKLTLRLNRELDYVNF